MDANAAPSAGPLRPIEYATIAIFTGLAVAVVVIAAVIPLAGAARLLAPVPMALIAARTRPRALVAATVTGAACAFALAGTGAAVSIVGSAVIGGIVGEIKRRGRGLGTLTVVTFLASPFLAAAPVALLFILVPLRTLVLKTFENTARGIAKQLDSFESVSRWINGFADAVIDYWWLWMWVTGVLGAVVALYVAWWVLGAVVDRVADIPSEDTLDNDGGLNLDGVQNGPSGPLPLTLAGVGFRYPGARKSTLSGIHMSIGHGEFVAVVGPNGSGKSTLAKLLAGRLPTEGTIQRPGQAALGRPGGTAMVLQRPETQMLGSRVADDVVWGLPPDWATEVDVEAILAAVGLTGLGGRETLDLSGGQQQRLAIAAALARHPALLIADEVTSMVDPAGRDELIALLRSLPQRFGISVVLITHRLAEAAVADRVIHLREGSIVTQEPDWEVALDSSSVPSAPRRRSLRKEGGRALTLNHAAHTYLQGSPWEVAALHDVSLRVNPGDGVLIVGGNGSGKTTLAWLLAGLIEPTSGTCELGSRPTSRQVGKVALAFQHARLQIQQANVADEIMAVGGREIGTREVGEVLELVGLPRVLAARPTDSLSGGQLRRVVLAALIASDPDLLVLDEPLAGLDPSARREVIGLLSRLRSAGMTLIIISHDFEALEEVCNQRVELVDGRLGAELTGDVR
ncbi:ABC transporter ATP-binding protein [Gordonia sp. CPCC 205333]|uniref:ABC transporter ATP-binding protein n=1 Tax=Gordonia sp. CPCC 205333 TaxID=3140790 RepID=UPI003AF35675